MKRKAPGDEDVLSASQAFLLLVDRWRDKCGRRYKIQYRVRSKDAHAELRIGGLDAVTVAQLGQLLDAEHADYKVDRVRCDVSTRAVVCRVVRGTRLEPSGKAYRFEHATRVDEVITKLVEDHRVDTCDAAAVAAAMRNVLIGFSSPSRETAPSVRRMPSRYELSVSIEEDDDYAWERLREWPRTTIDFQTKTLAVVVDRKRPDI